MPQRLDPPAPLALRHGQELDLHAGLAQRGCDPCAVSPPFSHDCHALHLRPAAAPDEFGNRRACVALYAPDAVDCRVRRAGGDEKRVLRPGEQLKDSVCRRRRAEQQHKRIRNLQLMPKLAEVVRVGIAVYELLFPQNRRRRRKVPRCVEPSPHILHKDHGTPYLRTAGNYEQDTPVHTRRAVRRDDRPALLAKRYQALLCENLQRLGRRAYRTAERIAHLPGRRQPLARLVHAALYGGPKPVRDLVRQLYAA